MRGIAVPAGDNISTQILCCCIRLGLPDMNLSDKRGSGDGKRLNSCRCRLCIFQELITGISGLLCIVR